MELSEYFKILYKKKLSVFFLILLFLLISALFSFAQDLNYSAKARLLLVQDFEQRLDPYSIAKSNQHTAFVFANIIKSGSFFDKVMEAKFDINKSYFSNSPKKDFEVWNDIIDTGAVDDSGIISLQVMHSDKYQAEQIMKALISVLTENYREYYKAPNDIEIKVIDRVSVSDYPVEPNILLNSLFGILFGVIFSFTYIYLFASSIKTKIDKRNDINEINRIKLAELKRAEEEMAHKIKILTENKNRVEENKFPEMTNAPQTNNKKQKDKFVKNNEKNNRQGDVNPRGDMKNLFG